MICVLRLVPLFINTLIDVSIKGKWDCTQNFPPEIQKYFLLVNLKFTWFKKAKPLHDLVTYIALYVAGCSVFCQYCATYLVPHAYTYAKHGMAGGGKLEEKLLEYQRQITDSVQQMLSNLLQQIVKNRNN